MRSFGLDLLIYLDGIAAGKEEEFQVISALSASGKYDPSVLFSDWYGTGSKEASGTEESMNDADTDFDFSSVSWELPADGDKKALDQLAQVMSTNGTLSLTGDDDDLDLAMDFTPEDREWL